MGEMAAVALGAARAREAEVRQEKARATQAGEAAASEAAAGEVAVTGKVAGVTEVTVNGTPATITGGSFDGTVELQRGLNLVEVVGIAIGPDYRDREIHGVFVLGDVVLSAAWAVYVRVSGLVVHAVVPRANGLEVEIELEVYVAGPR